MSALRIRDVRLIVAAVGVSSFGDFLLWVPLALHIQAMTGSALAVSAMFLALFGPMVLLGGVAGRLADRHENATCCASCRSPRRSPPRRWRCRPARSP